MAALTVPRGGQGSARKRLTQYMYATILWVTRGFRPPLKHSLPTRRPVTQKISEVWRCHSTQHAAIKATLPSIQLYTKRCVYTTASRLMLKQALCNPSRQSYTSHGKNVVLSLKGTAWFNCCHRSGSAHSSSSSAWGCSLDSNQLRQAGPSNAQLSVMSLLIVFSQQTNYLFFYPLRGVPSRCAFSINAYAAPWGHVGDGSSPSSPGEEAGYASWLQGHLRNKQPHTLDTYGQLRVAN